MIRTPVDALVEDLIASGDIPEGELKRARMLLGYGSVAEAVYEVLDRLPTESLDDPALVARVEAWIRQLDADLAFELEIALERVAA